MGESAGGKSQKDKKTASKWIWLALSVRDKGQGRKEEGGTRNEERGGGNERERRKEAAGEM